MRGILVIFLFLSCSLRAADLKTVLQKVQEVYANKNVSYSTKYSLFKGHKSTTVHSSYQGEVYSYNKLLYQKIGPSEFIYGDNYFLHISHEEKLVALAPAQKAMQQQVDLSQVLKECKSSEITDQGTYYKLVFTMKQTSGIPCSVIMMRVDKKNYTLQQMDLFYSYFEDYSETFGKRDMHQPHLKIEFTDMDLSPKERKTIFTLSTYLKQTNSLITPTGKCSGYELIDQRI